MLLNDPWMQGRRAFHAAWIVTLVLKLALAAWIPVMGDEAYYLSWARELAGGYYDHPPMVAWMVWCLRHVSHSILVLRLPVVLISTVLGFLIYRAVRVTEPTRAEQAATLYWLAPIHVLPMMMSPDVGLLFFGSGAIFLALAAFERRSAALSVAAGALLGLAFLSKYFALLIGAGLLVHWFLAEDRRRWSAVLAFGCLGFLPFLLFHLYWNQQHCWANLIFHASSRNIGHDFSPSYFGYFVGHQLYLITPFLLYFALRSRTRWHQLWHQPRARYFGVQCLVPLSIFALTALRFGQGLHWSLLFYMPFYIFMGLLLDSESLRRSVLLMTAFLALHLVLAAGLALAPLEFWKERPIYRNLALFTKTPEVVAELRIHLSPGDQLAAENYSMASVLEHHTGQPVLTFGSGSKFGRQDDLYFDFKALNGRDFLIFTYNGAEVASFAPFFESVEVTPITVRGFEYGLVRGRGFRFASYRERYLLPTREQYYRPAAWMPQASCPFTERHELGAY